MKVINRNQSGNQRIVHTFTISSQYERALRALEGLLKYQSNVACRVSLPALNESNT